MAMALGKVLPLSCVRHQLSLTQLRIEASSIPPQSSIICCITSSFRTCRPCGSEHAGGTKGRECSEFFFLCVWVRMHHPVTVAVSFCFLHLHQATSNIFSSRKSSTPLSEEACRCPAQQNFRWISPAGYCFLTAGPSALLIGVSSCTLARCFEGRPNPWLWGRQQRVHVSLLTSYDTNNGSYSQCISGVSTDSTVVHIYK